MDFVGNRISSPYRTFNAHRRSLYGFHRAYRLRVFGDALTAVAANSNQELPQMTTRYPSSSHHAMNMTA